MRPKTLAEVAQLTANGDSFDHCLTNFLDEFYAAPSSEALWPTPLLLAKTQGEMGQVQDAYLAATAEEIGRIHDFPMPPWTVDDARTLRYPWFAMRMSAIRAVLLLESPPAFRSRNLFVSENALTRV
ncbi:MAG: hypothetical protein WCP34_14785 [Pseudomonadota bacterium]